jgi:uncharacterized NAD(P)/FAD-binding protein YdhS
MKTYDFVRSEDVYNMITIAIIGAGLCGRLLALNLLRFGINANDVRIILLDREDEKYIGPAYSTDEDCHLLNVPAGRMGAYAEDPEHFLKWLHGRGITADRFDFLPRKIYREYIFELIRNALHDKNHNIVYKYIKEEVIDIEVVNNRAWIHMYGKEKIPADKVVLALGNFLPRNPSIKNQTAITNNRYIQNPWRVDIFTSLSDNDTVFFIGTGQTTVDLAISLYMRKHKGRIIAISRRGLLPMAHKGFEVYNSFYEEIKDHKNILEMFKIVRKHLENAERIGIDIRAVIDSLRPDTQRIWMGLPPDEKSRFMRHVFRYWEIIRSRIPPESQAIIDQMISSGQLKIIPGRLSDLREKSNCMEVYYTPRGDTRFHTEEAHLVVNCIGPEVDIEKVDHLLVTNLLKRGLIRPGPAKLGIDALPNSAIVGKGGGVSEVLYTLGSTMRGVLWEVLAVPDIRVQAETLAQLFLEENWSPDFIKGINL